MMFVASLAVLAIIAIAVVMLPFWRNARRMEAILGALLVAGIGIGLYLVIGRPDLVLQPPRQQSTLQPQEIEAMVAQLAQRLEANPDDVQGWTMLGRSYVVMGRFEAAARAFSEAQARTPEENPDLLASFAEARAMLNPEGLQSEIGALFERVLERDSRNTRGLWYGGLAAQARGESALAVQRWRALLETELPPEFRRVVESQVAALEGQLATPDEDNTSVFLQVEIEIAPEMADRTPPGGVLYLFVRAVDDPGQGPPLAARRMNNVDPPLKLSLTRDHLLRGSELPDTALKVVARISADGDPAPGPGDIEGSVEWQPSDADEIRIVLDSLRGS